MRASRTRSSGGPHGTPTTDAAGAAAVAVAVADHRDAARQTRQAYETALIAADLIGGADGRAEQLRLLRRAVALRGELPDAEESIDTLLRRLRTVAADAGATADELDAVESLLARVDREAQPLVAAELLVRRMHLRDITGQGFIDVDEMREAVRLAEADTTSAEYALALAELAHAEVWAGHHDAPAHASAAIAVARGTDDLRALSHALAAGSMTAGIDDDAPTAQALAHEAVEAARAAGDWWAYVHAMMWEADAFRTWGSAAYSLLIRDRRVEMVERGGPRAYAAWMSAVEAQNWLIIGDWRECDARLRIVLGSDPGPLGDVMARLVAARAATLRGRQAEAESHLLRVEELMVDGSAYLGMEFDAVHAEVRFGAHDHDGAFRAAMNGARNSGAPPTRCEWLMPLAARALADRVQSAHDNGRTDADALEALDALVAQFPRVIRDIGPTTGVRGRLLDAFDAQYAAEQLRARGDPRQADAWMRAVDACAEASTAVGGGVLDLARGGGAARPRPRPADRCGDAPARPRARPAARGAAGRGRAARPREARTDPDRGAGCCGIRRAGRAARPDRAGTGGARPHRRRPHVRRDRPRPDDQREDGEHARLAPAGEDGHRQSRRARAAGPPRDDGSRASRPASRRCGPRRAPRRTPTGAA